MKENSNLNYFYPQNYERILITGGLGFIGSHLVRRLIKDTEVEIFNLDKESYSSNHYSINQVLKENKEYRSRYKFLKADLSNKEETLNAINFANPDLVFHLAAESHVDRSIDNPSNFISSNIVGTFNLLEILKKYHKHLPINKSLNFKFLHISTDEVFGSLGDNGRFSELSRYDPRSPYSASKASSDHLVKAWFHTYNFPSIVTNCSNNYGPWQFPEKLIPNIILKILNNEEIPIYGNGQNIRDWLYVDDHIDALLKIASKGKSGNSYCIGGNSEKKNIDIAYFICNHLDILLSKKEPSSELIRFVSDRPGHDYRYSVNAEYTYEEIGWYPKTIFKNGLETTINWYLENINWCKNVLNKSGYIGERIGKI